MMDEELKPCPFCGKEPKVTYEGGGYVIIRCGNADCLFKPKLPGYFPLDQAHNLWNTRAEHTCFIKPDDAAITYCSSCNAMFALDYFEQTWDYCPSCGARVIKK